MHDYNYYDRTILKKEESVSMKKIVCENCGCEINLTDDLKKNGICTICGAKLKNIDICEEVEEQKLLVVGDQGMPFPGLSIIVCYKNHIEILNKKTRVAEKSFLYSQINNIRPHNLTNKITFSLSDLGDITVKAPSQFAPSVVVKEIEKLKNNQ